MRQMANNNKSNSVVLLAFFNFPTGLEKLQAALQKFIKWALKLKPWKCCVENSYQN